MRTHVAHLSVDDVLACLRELGEDGYASVCDHVVFRSSRRVHERHGAAA